jgi:T5SS/PEP-CTERM-associated repeat protein
MMRNHHRSWTTPVCAVAVSVFLASGATHAPAQEAYYSLTGDFQNASDTQRFLFETSSSIGSAEKLYFATYSHSGGMNQAGSLISSGGFDPILTLFDDASAWHGTNDDGHPFPNRDSYLTWTGQAPDPFTLGFLTTDPLPADGYELELTAFAGPVPSHWAVDLVGPAAKTTLTGLLSTGASIVQSLMFGTTGGGTAELLVAAPDTLTLTGEFFVAFSGNGNVDLQGIMHSGQSALGVAVGSHGTVTLSPGATWTASDPVVIAERGQGDLNIASGSTGVGRLQRRRVQQPRRGRRRLRVQRDRPGLRHERQPRLHVEHR